MQKTLLLMEGGLSLGLTKRPDKYFKIVKKISKEWQKINKRALQSAIRKLYQSKLIDYRENNDGTISMILTNDGKKKTIRYNLDSIKIKKPGHWDRLWRLVIFDIPEKKRQGRRALVEKLKELGFFSVQKSVFIHPFECKNEIDFITEIFNLKPLRRPGHALRRIPERLLADPGIHRPRPRRLPATLQGGEPPRAAALRDHQERHQARQPQRSRRRSLRVWYDLRKRARFIVEDEGEGFTDLDEWNDFFRKRQTALFEEDFDAFLALASYRGPESDDDDGGNSLIAALEYWNGGMIFNDARNKVGVVRWFSGGSALSSRRVRLGNNMAGDASKLSRTRTSARRPPCSSPR